MRKMTDESADVLARSLRSDSASADLAKIVAVQYILFLLLESGFGVLLGS